MLGRTIRKLEKFWIKIECEHGWVIQKRRKKSLNQRKRRQIRKAKICTGNDHLRKCKMRNIWWESSCTEDSCKLCKSVLLLWNEECWQEQTGLQHTRLLLLWPKEARPQLEHPVTSPALQLHQPAGRAGQAAEPLGVLGKNWWCSTSGKGWKSLHISKLLLEGGNNLLLPALEKEAVSLHSEREFQVNVSEIHTRRDPKVLG